ncbi:uncharacterized protein LOC129292060 isoform X2 [Prosopis cineraria]|nr:uncharacterized protein LOC129292060 isoform X2 [Prosopis cineraria]
MRKNNHGEILGFRKVFKIPNGVVSDQIKAKYSEEESALKICMPKLVKGISGAQIEAVKEQEEFGKSSGHKVVKEFELHLIENPSFKIRNKYGESEREEDGKEETGEEVNKNSQVELNVEEDHIPENIGEGRQQVYNKNILIQSLEEVGEEIIAGTKEKEIEDRDVEVKEGAEESLQTKTSRTFVEDTNGDSNRIEAEELELEAEDHSEGSVKQEMGNKEGFEAIMETKVKELPEEPKESLQVVPDESNGVVEITEGGQTEIEEPMFGRNVRDEINEEKGKLCNNDNNECGESGNEESQVTKKQQDSDVKLLKSSQLESPRFVECNNEIRGPRESEVGGQEIEVEADEHYGVKVEASEEEKANMEERDGVYVEIISKQIDEVEDVQVEADDVDEKASVERDDVYVEISQVVEERREIPFKENEEKKMLDGRRRRPLFIAGSAAFVGSLVIFFIRQRRVGKR